MDGRNRPPKAKRKLGVPAADSSIRITGPKHGHQSRRVRSVESFLHYQVSEGAAILLTSVFGPEAADLCLLGSPHGAVDGTQCFDLIVIVNPLLASKGIGALVRGKLRGTSHREGHHLAEPRRDGRRKCRWGRLPEAKAFWRRIREHGQQAVVRAPPDQGLRGLFSDSDTCGNVGGRV